MICHPSISNMDTPWAADRKQAEVIFVGPELPPQTDLLHHREFKRLTVLRVS